MDYPEDAKIVGTLELMEIIALIAIEGPMNNPSLLSTKSSFGSRTGKNNTAILLEGHQKKKKKAT